MQHTRSGAAPNVRFASPAGSRPTTITEGQSERSRPSSARSSSVTDARAAGGQLYEIWEPPDEAALDHYKPLPGEPKTSAGTRLGQAVAAAVRAKYTGRPVNLPRFSFSRSSRTRSVVSESDVSSVSHDGVIRDGLNQVRLLQEELAHEKSHRDELLRDAQRLGLPIRAPTAPPRTTVVPPRTAAVPPRTAVVPPRTAIVPPQTVAAPPRPATTPLRPATTLPRPVAAPSRPATAPPRPAPAPPVSRTLANALAPSASNPHGMPMPINSNAYQVWRASVARPRNPQSAASPYTQMIDDAMYKPKPSPPPGTIIESGGEGVARAEKALYAELSERYADERIFWTMPPDHDERVRNRIQAVDKMSRELALYGLDMYLATGIKGAIMTNAGYHAPEWPTSPAYDWITFNDARRTGDKTLQESIVFTDPSTTTLVFIFLVSRSGESMAIWRRKFTVPPSEQLRRNLELRRVALEARRLGQVYEIDLNPPMMIPEDSWVVVTPGKQKKRHKFPWFKVDWGK